MKKSPKKKTITKAIVASLTGLALVAVLPAPVGSLLRPPIDRFKARRILSRSHTREELQGAVGKLGGFFPLSDGSWVAVRYTDSHSWPGYSCAVALDSAGQWLNSNHHFCGRFRSFQTETEKYRELDTALGGNGGEFQRMTTEQYPEMFALSSSTNLAAARAQLLKMGFTE